MWIKTKCNLLFDISFAKCAGHGWNSVNLVHHCSLIIASKQIDRDNNNNNLNKDRQYLSR